MKAVVFGVREFACVGLEELLALEVEVPLVVTYPRGAADAPGYRLLAEVARSRGIRVTTPSSCWSLPRGQAHTSPST